jgi:hypothetical protein
MVAARYIQADAEAMRRLLEPGAAGR